MDEQWITSVGIDLGTSTTKWIMSRLKLTKTSGGFSLPRYEITERIIEYMSPIYTTPLKSLTEIDVTALSELLAGEYARAGLTPESVQSGAVIITGETATKQNAEQLVHSLAEHAGQFVVATAGSDLESLLAGKGSGAQKRSGQVRGVVANVDIGGGTANTAYFQDGEMIATVTLHVGGRLVRLDGEGCVVYVADPIQRWASHLGEVKLPEPGTQPDMDELKTFCEQMVDALIGYIKGDAVLLEWCGPLLVTEPSEPLPTPSEIWISGGIGGMMDAPSPRSVKETAMFGDIGPLLAAVLQERAGSSDIPIRAAEESKRATVIGAGTQTTEVSGSTLFYSPGTLPLRNIPVARCQLPDSEESAEADERLLRIAVGAAVRKALSVYGADRTNPPFALALQGGGYFSYLRMQRLTDVVSEIYHAEVSAESVLLVVCEQDMAKAIGNALAKRNPGLKLVCLDQLLPKQGDYIDVGMTLKEDIVPVVIKTLVFTKNGE